MNSNLEPNRFPWSGPVVRHAGFCWLVALGLVAGAATATCAADEGEVVAISAKASPTYVRRQLPDGSLAPETYTFGNGGRWAGAMRDIGFEKITFDDVARVIARPLKERNYVSGLDPQKIGLLIMVYWGTTDGSGGSARGPAAATLAGGQAGLNGARQNVASVPDPQGKHIMPLSMGSMVAGKDWSISTGFLFGAGLNQDSLLARVQEQDVESEFDAVIAANEQANRQRDRILLQDAALLGYDSELAAANRLAFATAQIRRQDIIDELEDNRYFVVLMAYDFPLLMKEKKASLLWETRFSVRQRGTDFAQSLAAITEQASRYFGQNSNGLTRRTLPAGHVKLGELKVVPDR